MCRIAGIISKTIPVAQLDSDIQKMCTAMAHGGPDGEGFYVEADHGLAFGHRRLAIVDLTAAGHQPMLADQGNLVITFNGEIYNYPQLKAELAALSYPFVSHCDTEVILAAYQTWGTAGFARLQGMFAFALFDQKNNLTFLVRDPQGIKPLYYSTTNQALVFASEVKAFKAIESIRYTINADWEVLFLAFGHIPEPFTTLQEVQALPKGHCLIWDRALAKSEMQGIQFVQEPTTGLTTATLQQQLKKAVEDHLLADAPIGVFLSGGIDSSILTLLTDQLIGERLKTVSINFDVQQLSEQPFQELIAEKTHGQHTAYTITEQEYVTHFDRAVSAMDQPTQDGINSWFVNKCAHENGLKAVLSGIGADENFGGYPSFSRIKTAEKLQALPKWLLKKIAKLPSTKFKRFYFLSYQNPLGIYLFLRGSFNAESIAKLLPLSVKEIDQIVNKVKVDEGYNVLSDVKKAAFLENNFYMQNQLIKDTDFMSMAHGVEVRVPYLDNNLLAALAQTPDDLRFKKIRPKQFLIDAFTTILPSAIWDRQKMGFSFPFAKWMAKIDRLTDTKNYQGNAGAAQLITEFNEGKLHWSQAFIIYQLFNSKLPQKS